MSQRQAGEGVIVASSAHPLYSSLWLLWSVLLYARADAFLPPLSPVRGTVPSAAVGDVVCTSLGKRAAVS